MRETWIETTLGDVAEWYSGGTPKAGKSEYYDGGDIPWVVIADLMKTEIYETATCITPAGLAEIGGRLAPVGSVLISMYATVGRPGITHVPVATNQAIAWSVPKTEVVLPRFLLLTAQSLEDEISSMARGATQRNINRAMLREFTFKLPPIEEQRQIVDLMSSVDSYIAALQQQADAARVARSAVLSELLSAGGEDWIEMTIESFARLVPGKYIPKSKYEENGPYFIYGSNSVMGKYSTALIDVPHVVMAAIGAYAGAVRYSSQPSWVNNNAFGLVTNDNVDPFFFYLWLEQCLDLRQVVVGTGQPYVQRPALKNTVVNVPPVKEQRRIVDIVSSLDEVFSSTERAIFEAKRLRSGLLSDLLSGHHEIPESYDQLLGAA